MNTPIEVTFQSGATLYAILHNPDGKVWNTSSGAWESYNVANWALYAAALTEQGASGYYRAAYPTDADLDYVLATQVVYAQGGGTPAISDAPGITMGQSQGVSVAAIRMDMSGAENLEKSLSTEVLGVVTSAEAATTTTFTTDLTDSEPDVYPGRLVIFTSGNLFRQLGNITAYSPTNGRITVGGPFTKAPTVADEFILV